MNGTDVITYTVYHKIVRGSLPYASSSTTDNSLEITRLTSYAEFEVYVTALIQGTSSAPSDTMYFLTQNKRSQMVPGLLKLSLAGVLIEEMTENNLSMMKQSLRVTLIAKFSNINYFYSIMIRSVVFPHMVVKRQTTSNSPNTSSISVDIIYNVEFSNWISENDLNTVFDIQQSIREEGLYMNGMHIQAAGADCTNMDGECGRGWCSDGICACYEGATGAHCQLQVKPTHTKPRPPHHLYLKIKRDTVGTVHWLAPEMNGTDVITYLVYHKVVGGLLSYTSSSTTNKSLEITGLSGYAMFEVYVTAVIQGTSSPPSDTMYFIPRSRRSQFLLGKLKLNLAGVPMEQMTENELFMMKQSLRVALMAKFSNINYFYSVLIQSVVFPHMIVKRQAMSNSSATSSIPVDIMYHVEFNNWISESDLNTVFDIQQSIREDGLYMNGVHNQAAGADCTNRDGECGRGWCSDGICACYEGATGAHCQMEVKPTHMTFQYSDSFALDMEWTSDFNTPSSSVYTSVKMQVESIMSTYYASMIPNFLNLHIDRFRRGSVIIDYTVELSSRPDTIMALLATVKTVFLSNTVNVDGQDIQFMAIPGNPSKNPSATYGCTDGSVCVIYTNIVREMAPCYPVIGGGVAGVVLMLYLVVPVG